MDHQDVDAAVAASLKVLAPHAAEDWTVPAGPLEWTCWQTAAHIAHDLLAYAGQVAARPADSYLPFDLTVRPAASPTEVLQTITACGQLLSCVLAAGARGLTPSDLPGDQPGQGRLDLVRRLVSEGFLTLA